MYRTWLALTLLPLVAVCAEHSPLDAFPDAGEGMTRLVIALPAVAEGEESDRKVELVAGKVIATDGVNQYRLDARIDSRTLEGWGYTYYEVSGSGNAATTLMAVPEGTEPETRFVAGASELVRYNPRLPIVVYAPAGFEVRYRIWRAAAELATAPGG